MKKAKTILDFWFGAPGTPEHGKPRKIWFEKNAAFDAELRTRFGALHGAAVEGRIDAWQATPQGALALIVLLDQLSRNIHRDTPLAFAADGHAQTVARNSIARRFDRALTPIERGFIYLPFEHAEDLALQRLSLRLFASLRGGAADMEYPRRHYEIVARFGRFPHRNQILGRQSTEEEIAFLKQPGSGF
jgi:uncharacterized protein (DUF924 family)